MRIEMITEMMYQFTLLLEERHKAGEEFYASDKHTLQMVINYLNDLLKRLED